MRAMLWLTVAFVVGCEVTEEPGDSLPDSQPDDSVPASVLGCDNPALIMDRDVYSGFVRCADGAINREEPAAVNMAWYAERMDGCWTDEPHKFARCLEDSDCSEQPNGKCTVHSTGMVDYCQCAYLCENDDDCYGGICISPAASAYGWPECVSSACTRNSDCPSGECGLGTASDHDATYARLACRSEQDECHSSADCDDGGCLPRGANGRFICEDYWVYD